MSIVQIIVFTFWVNRRVSPFSAHMKFRVLSKTYEAVEWQAFHRVIALLRTGQDREQKLVRPRLFALFPVAVSRLWKFWTFFKVSIVSELKSPCSALCTEARKYTINLGYSVSLAPLQENKTLLNVRLELAHSLAKFDATLLVQLLVVRSPQVVVAQHRVRKDFAHEVHLFG